MVSPLKCLNNSNICRLCLESKPSLINIFSYQDSSEDNIASKVMACVSIEVVYNDDGPQKICHECMDSVNGWVKFKRICDITNSFLKTQLSPSKFSKSDKAVCTSLLLQRDIDSLLGSNDIFPISENDDVSQPARPSSTISSILNFHIDKIQKRRLSKQNDNGELDNNELNEDTNASSIWNLCLNSDKTDSNNADKQRPCCNINDQLSEKVAANNNKTCSVTIVNCNVNNAGTTPSKNRAPPNDDDGFRFNNANRYLHVELEEEHNYPIRNDDDTAVARMSDANSFIPIDNTTIRNDRTIVEKENQDSSNRRPKFKIKTKKGYTCEICKVIYKKFSDLLSHDVTVHESLEKNVVCPVCSQLFLSETRLEVHSVKHQEKKFECQVCGKMYVNQKSLYSHRVVHRSQYRCNRCAYIAPSERILREHQSRHEHQKQFQCPICNQWFSTSWCLSRHRKSKHDNIRHAYKCNVCDAIFTRFDDLKTHANVHNTAPGGGNGTRERLVCDVCGLCYKGRRSLKNHIRKHNAPRFHCSTCQKSFYTRFELAAHSQTHSNMKGFFCSICGRSFAYKITLKRHIFSKCDPELRNRLVRR